jgi:hypothetical protein
MNGGRMKMSEIHCAPRFPFKILEICLSLIDA